MPTYSTRLGIKLIGTGEESNSWGATTNSTFENTFEQAITSVYSKALGAASSPLTLTSNLQGPVTVANNEWGQAAIRFSGHSTAFVCQGAPAVERIYIILNDGTAAGSIQLKIGSNGNTSDIIPAGGRAVIASDGTNFHTIVSSAGGAGTATAVNSATFTAVAGQRLLINTSNTGGGANAPITITLPPPAASTVGDQIGFVDIADHFDTNALTINPNGGKVFGATANGTVSTEGAGFTLIFTGTDFGWKIMEK